MQCLYLLLLLVCSSGAKGPRCPSSAPSCDECVRSGPECAWCAAPDSDIRCQTSKVLRRAGCPKDLIYNPQGGVQLAKNDSSTQQTNADAVFLQPQEVSVQLRPGVSQSFLITVTRPLGQPIGDVTMDASSVPAGVNITFSYTSSGSPGVIEVHVKAKGCPSENGDSNQQLNRTGPWSVHITPRGYSPSVSLQITLLCECECTKTRQESSLACSGHGARVCGRCECYEPYVGRRCHNNLASLLENDDACRPGPNQPVCSNRGSCVDGSCECNQRENPSEKYSGRYCECANFDCPKWQNRVCGGRGQCICSKCLCDDGWTDEDCSCSMDTASCAASNGMLCNNRGACLCGTCRCEPPYAGPTCETCPSCTNLCEQYSACAECQAFGTGAAKDRCDRECSSIAVTTVETEQDLTGQMCKWRSRNTFCYFYFSYSRTPSGSQLTVSRTTNCPS
ncbi:unnamed protein product [Tetraodon nigroviridis]|uniref:(spotted green pufferfish) hypothetical protein n=1 Tax=Tetraodon nigroviridis TaxID=99883 RepID=Q4SH71_TETNG|nr:unnamed protein product [Tetraodon nigroviridis]